MTPEQSDQFDGYIRKWQSLLGLNDWRLIRSNKKPNDICADIDPLPIHRMAVYRLGNDFGKEKVNAQSLESTACHEVLHVLVASYKAMCDAKADPDLVMSEEHRIIHTLERLLVPQ